MPSVTESRPIVVGYDASGPALAALDWAATLAEHEGAPLTVLYAAQQIVYAQDAGYGIWKPAEVLESARDVARDGVQRLAKTHPNLRTEAAGSLSSATVALDETSTHASMIVVGSHGRGRLGSVMLGSTAYAVSGHARCPVVVVRDGTAPLPGPKRPVVAGSDGSVGAERAVEAAADLATRSGASLVVTTSWMPPPPDPWDRPPMGYTTVATSLQDRQERAESINLTAVARTRDSHPELTVIGRVSEARPEDAVMGADPQAALLVLGSRGHGTLAGAVLGSTARVVLHQSTMPVMIVH